MNNKFLKIIFTFFIISIFTINIQALNSNQYLNEETNYKVVIEDDANLLNEQQILNLIDEMKSLTKYGNVAFKSINSNPHSTNFYASNYYHEIFGTASGTLFLIDMDNRYIYIFSDGNNYKTITDSKAEIITDNVYKYASSGDYYKCASVAFEQVKALLNNENIPETMKHISNIFISFITIFLVNYLIVLLCTKINKATNKEILNNCNIIFNTNNVKAEKVGSHKVYSPVSSSSSSGGGSSGGGGGGRSSGGGGGHRF